MKKYCSVIRVIVHTQMKILRRRWVDYNLLDLYDEIDAPYCLKCLMISTLGKTEIFLFTLFNNAYIN